ncbi:MAG TPA: fimbria/pilus outer membrane usher protein [Burkholderiaceae bacterium]|nr:fimbria/pilus outer membrane usher protein [Burkholderiaceae bacterium]
MLWALLALLPAWSGAQLQAGDLAQAGAVLAPLDLYLSVTVNGNSVDRLQSFSYRNGALWASPEVLRGLGFKRPEGGGYVNLESLPGVRAIYDEAAQSVSIQAPLSELDLPATVVNTSSEGAVPLNDGRGVLLNYDVYANRESRGAGVLSAASEFRAFSSHGVFSNTAYAQAVNGQSRFLAGEADQGWSTHNVRMDTSWRSSWPDKAITLTLGDTLTGGLPWSRSTRIGGIRLGRNFALQPYRTTTPLPTFMGSAVVPSAVDLYIDGIKRYDGRVPAGPFQLNAIPGITGHGNALIVLTDPSGRRTQLDIPFYASSTLLDEGLADWSLETGYVRQEYGISSFRYASDPVVSGTLRYGLTKSLTMETHAEAGGQARVGGLGSAATLGGFGQVSGAYAVSSGAGRQGRQYSAGYQWAGRHLSVGANTTRTSGDYRDVAALYGNPPPATSDSLVVSTSFQSIGSLSVSYIKQAYPGETANRYAGAYWSRRVGERAMVSLSYNQNLDIKVDRHFYIGLSISLEGRVNASSSMQRNGGKDSYNVSASQPTHGNTGWGWSLYGRQDSGAASGSAQVDYRGRHGDYRAGLSAHGSSSSAYLGTSGSLVAMDGSLFASRRIYDSFAVISTDGVPNVPIKLHNNPVGMSDERGYLLVEPLAAYQKNPVSIDPLGLPVNLKIDRVAADVATHERSGALLRFGIRPLLAASVTLHDHDGKPVSVGATIELNGAPSAFMVGYDGVAYLEGLQARNTVDVTAPDFRCTVQFDYTDPGDTILQIGPLQCE